MSSVMSSPRIVRRSSSLVCCSAALTSSSRRSDRRPAAETEKPRRQSRRLVHRGRDVIQRRALAVGQAVLVAQAFAPARNNHEQVVEVVRNAARQLPDRLHAVCLLETRLQSLLLTEVAREAGEKYLAGHLDAVDRQLQRKRAAVLPASTSFATAAVGVGGNPCHFTGANGFPPGCVQNSIVAG